MTKVSIHEAKTKLSALIAQVERLGEKVTIYRYGRPVAELVPVQHGSRTCIDPELSQIVVKGDMTEPTEAEWEDV
jgi:prevent-host-death family protein